MCVCVCVCVSVCVSVCLCVYQSHFFIHSSIEGHLGCFHTLATVNNAAVKMGVWISIRDILFPSDIYPEVGLVDHIVVLFLIFKDPPYCFP